MINPTKAQFNLMNESGRNIYYRKYIYSIQLPFPRALTFLQASNGRKIKPAGLILARVKYINIFDKI